MFLVNLEDVDGHAAGGGELLVANMALEVLGLLMLHQYLLIFKLPIAVVAPHLIDRASLLLLPHWIRFQSANSTTAEDLICNWETSTINRTSNCKWWGIGQGERVRVLRD